MFLEGSFNGLIVSMLIAANKITKKKKIRGGGHGGELDRMDTKGM